MRARNSLPPVAGSVPSTRTAPDVGARKPSSISMVVVLPAPLGPSTATISPASTVNDTPRTASTSP